MRNNRYLLEICKLPGQQCYLMLAQPIPCLESYRCDQANAEQLTTSVSELIGALLRSTYSGCDDEEILHA